MIQKWTLIFAHVRVKITLSTSDSITQRRGSIQADTRLAPDLLSEVEEPTNAPSDGKAGLSKVSLRRVLQGNTLLDKLSSQDLNRVMNHIEVTSFPKNSRIIEEGSVEDTLYVVMQVKPNTSAVPRISHILSHHTMRRVRRRIMIHPGSDFESMGPPRSCNFAARVDTCVHALSHSLEMLENIRELTLGAHRVRWTCM